MCRNAWSMASQDQASKLPPVTASQQGLAAHEEKRHARPLGRQRACSFPLTGAQHKVPEQHTPKSLRGQNTPENTFCKLFPQQISWTISLPGKATS